MQSDYLTDFFSFFLQIAFIMTLVQYQPPTYEGYHYPVFARALGLLLAVIPLIPLPVLMVIQLVKTPGSFMEVLFFFGYNYVLLVQ